MLCRVLLAAIGISYLVCVLFLSGIQKEDLDVSLLKKMRHYDINFDKNNEQLRTECLNDTRRKVSKVDNDRTTTEKEKEVTMATNTPNTVYNTVTLDTSELKSVLKYLKHKKKIRNPPTTESYKWNNFEDTAEMKRLFEKLISDNDNRIKKTHYTHYTQDNVEQSPTEDTNNKLPKLFRKLDASESEIQFTNTHNTTENKTSMEIVRKNKDNATKETNNNGFDINNLKDQIGRIFAEYLSKKISLPITTKPEIEKRVTDIPQINNHEIEQKFASSIAAINKLNENIAILQKNINGAKFTNPTISIKSKENGTNFDDTNSKLEKEVREDTFQNVAKSISDNRKINTENTQNVSKLHRIYNNDDISMTAEPKNIAVTQTNRDSLKNSLLEFTPKVNGTFDTLDTKYDKERQIESQMLENAKNNQVQYNLNTQDMVVQQYDFDRQKLADLLINSKSSKNNQFEFSQKDLKEITNYSYEKQRNFDNTNAVKFKKKYNEDQLPFISDPQNIQDMINYGYYNQRQPANRMQRFQYNNDVLGDSLLLGGHPDNIHSYDTDKITDDLNIPVHQNNGDVFKNIQIPYPLASHFPQENGYDKQVEPNTHVMDVQSAIDVLKNKQFSLPFQIQNGKDSLNSGFEIPNRLDSHVLKPQESFMQLQFPFQIQNVKDTLNSGFDNQNDLDARTSKPKENLDNYKGQVNISNDTQKDQINFFSLDMISKIAESVKEIVLKDLKKEIMPSTMSTTAIPLITPTVKTTESSIKTTAFTSPTITISTTSTPMTTTSTTTKPTTTSTSMPTTITTSKPTTATVQTMPTCTTTSSPITTITDTTIAVLTNKTQKNNDSKVQDATQAIQKFIQLFEQMKSVQDKTIKTNEKALQPKMGKSKYNVPIVMFPQPLPPINPFGIRVPSKQMPIIVHNYIPPTLNHPPFPPSYITSMETSNSMSRIHQPPNFEPHRFPNAVMIQTNKHEIQPLGIPMVKPDAMNLNIVMTTQNPLWSRQERDRWNYMYKYGRSPDKQKDVKNVKNSLSVYSNDYSSDSKGLNSNHVLNKEALLIFNKSKAIDDKIRLNILKKFDSYNKPENADKNAIVEIRNRMLSQVNQFNKLDTSKYQPLITNKLKPNNYIDDSNIEAYINQMANHNENVFNMPYNSRVDTNPMYNIYKDVNINPNNLLYGQLQNRGLINEIDPYAHKQPRSNYFIQRQPINAGSTRPTNYQNGNTQFITKENMLGGANAIYHSNTASGPFNTIPNNVMENARQQFRSPYSKPISDTQVTNINVMPMRDINNYSDQPKPYRTDRGNYFKKMPNNGANLRPTLEHTIPKIASSEYQYNKRLENRLPKNDDVKPSLKSNIEKLYDNPSRMETKEKTLVTKERNYARPSFRNPEASNEFSSTMNKIKMKFENPRYYSSPSEEDSNREFTKDNLIRPYHGDITNRNKVNEQTAATQPQMNLISAVFGHLDKHKTSNEGDQSFDRHNHQNPKYRSHSDSTNSNVNIKVRRPHEDSDSDYKYSGNVRGFHDKLESSDGWPDSPSDCGFDERCMSSLKILSRHQQPLDGKKNGKYDDSRFKSFLNTQQKVNQMLEMILATKADEFHSVEHA